MSVIDYVTKEIQMLEIEISKIEDQLQLGPLVSSVKGKNKKYYEYDRNNRGKKISFSKLGGTWYPKDGQKLSSSIDKFFKVAKKRFYVPQCNPKKVRALIVPHAGYKYSGQCAATAYQTLLENNQMKNTHINQVVIIGIDHAANYSGIALPQFNVYSTPLGEVIVDVDSINDLLKDNDIFKVMTTPFESNEHSFEVQVPFIQKSVKHFKIVPMLVGKLNSSSSYEKIGKVLNKIIDDKTLVIVSTDFTHHGSQYRFYQFDKNILDNVRRLDSNVYQAIQNKSMKQFDKATKDTTVCGERPLRILISLMSSGADKALKGELRLSCYYTSAHVTSNSDYLFDVSDSRSKSSVSYVGAVLVGDSGEGNEVIVPLTGYEKEALVSTARRSLENSFTKRISWKQKKLIWPIISKGVQMVTGVFVTLTKPDSSGKFRLRGCIGRTTEDEKPLYVNVVQIAKDAAFEDSRFSEVTRNELHQLKYSVSVLTVPRVISSLKEYDVRKHGIILTRGFRGAVYLPSVAKMFNYDRVRLLESLSIKAGMNKDDWKKDNVKYQVFEELK